MIVLSDLAVGVLVLAGGWFIMLTGITLIKEMNKKPEPAEVPKKEDKSD